MTNPVILLGTQSNGETLPVQVDAFGRLVAEGLQGPPGPEGPPGAGLPPDPYEGALLGWLNGELAWVGGSVPIPNNVFGPITGWDAQSGLITVEGAVPDTVGNGVYIYQCEPNGTRYTTGWLTSEQWSAGVVSRGESMGVVSDMFNPTQEWKKGLYTDTGNALSYVFPTQVSYAAKVEAWVYGVENANTGLQVRTALCDCNPWSLDEGFVQTNTGRGTGAWATIPTEPNGTFNTISVCNYSNTGGIGGIRVDNKVMVDSSLSLNLRVNQVLNNTIIGVPSESIDFEVGKYLQVPEQKVAPWVLYGNDPSSLIDHLRSS